MVKKSTPKTFKAIGQIIGTSPLKVQHLAGGLFGGLGRTSFNPVGILKNSLGRFIQAKGGEKEQRAWNLKDSLEEGYYTARLRAKRLFEDKKPREARKIINNWNREAKNSIKQIKKIDNWKEILDSEIRYTFEEEDVRRIKLKNSESGIFRGVNIKNKDRKNSIFNCTSFIK